MGTIDELFVKGDIREPENRVNLALFSLMQQDWFREWILKMLCLPAEDYKKQFDVVKTI